MPRIVLRFLRLLMWAAICVACAALVGVIVGHVWPWRYYDALGLGIKLEWGRCSIGPWFQRFQPTYASGGGPWIQWGR